MCQYLSMLERSLLIKLGNGLDFSVKQTYICSAFLIDTFADLAVGGSWEQDHFIFQMRL